MSCERDLEATGAWGAFAWNDGGPPRFEISTDGPFHHKLVGFFRPVEDS